MIHALKRLFVLFALAAVATGCASTVEINSDPPGADVTIDGQYIGETPTTYSDSSVVMSTRQVILEKQGYETQRAQLRRDGDINVLAVVGGFFLCWVTWLWALDYPSYVEYKLRPGDDDTEQRAANPEVDPEAGSITFQLQPASDAENYVWDPADHAL